MTIRDRRILAAQAAVKMHQVVQERPGDTNSTDLTDLLTDLRHWASEKNVNFRNCILNSEDHFNAERT